jgi:AraC family transcriptional regulator
MKVTEPKPSSARSALLDPQPFFDLGAFCERRFPSLCPTHLLPAARYGLRHLLATITVGEIPGFAPIAARWHVVTFVLRGATRANWRWGRREVRRHCRPGSVTITVTDDEHEVRCAGNAEALSWAVDPVFLRSVAERELERPCGSLETVSLQGGVDDRLWELGRRMAAELRAPRYASQLYFDTLNTQLAICLVRDHSSLVVRDGGRGPQVGDQRIRAAIDFIDANLGWSITLDELAAEADLSPGYFVTAFRQATGLPPHRYVLKQRVERAKLLLAEPDRTISQIALDVGFSSQSHLTSVFRRTTGMTPKGYREAVLSL